MALLDIHPGRRLADALLSLLEVHPAALLGQRRDRATERRTDQRLAEMPQHLLDDIGVTRTGQVGTDDDLQNTVSLTAALRS